MDRGLRNYKTMMEECWDERSAARFVSCPAGDGAHSDKERVYPGPDRAACEMVASAASHVRG